MDKLWTEGDTVRWAFALAGILGGALLLFTLSYRRWLTLIERERFLLGMKAASHPENLTAEERTRLKRVRSPWWAVWRWGPDLWRRLPF
ncbi:MAG TPA: hypothetical protein VJH87_15505 [Vicinamibacteria bacterium]|nr:hypothetical protein [Vicinamibacteria bacterium]